MQFGLSESQQFLKDGARKFFAGECPSAEMRRLMETDTAYDAELWSKLIDQGYTGIIFPEAYGGVGLGKVELMLLMEEAGRALLPGPFFSTVALAGSVLDAVAKPAHKKKYLAPICRGEARATVAIPEAGGSWNPADVRLSVTRTENSPAKNICVPDAAVADFIIVVARNGVFVVDSKANGMKISPMSGMDLTRKVYVSRIQQHSSGKTGRHGEPRLARSISLLLHSRRRWWAACSGRSTSLSNTRKRASNSANPSECFRPCSTSARTCTWKPRAPVRRPIMPRWALEENSPDAAIAVSIAKMYASDAARTVGNRGIQIHGGMGFTWENDIHLYYRRAKASETAFGDATFHRERIASAGD